jgi:hypothetical protein
VTVSMIPLSEVLEMPSNEFGNETQKVRDFLDIKRCDTFYPELVESVRRNGVHMPVLIVDGVFENGHHRVAAAQDLGLTEIPYTTDDVLGWTETWPDNKVPKSWCWDED